MIRPKKINTLVVTSHFAPSLCVWCVYIYTYVYVYIFMLVHLIARDSASTISTNFEGSSAYTSKLKTRNRRHV